MKARFKLLLGATLLLLLLAGCRTRKALPGRSAADYSAATTETILAEAAKGPVYQWIRMKTPIRLETEGNTYEANMNLRLKRDSIVWLTANMMLELMRARITNDSGIMLDRVKQQYHVIDRQNMEQFIGVSGLTVTDIQRVLLAVPPYDSAERYTTTNREGDLLTVERPRGSYVEKMTIDLKALRLSKYRIELNQNQYFQADYSNYKTTAGEILPGRVEIVIQFQDRTVVQLQDISYTLLENDDAPLQIPSGYSRAD